MRGDEWFELGSGLHRVTWWRTLWDTAGARFWCSIGVAIAVTLAGMFLDWPIVIAVGIGAVSLLVLMWLAVTTSEYMRHRKPLRSTP